MTNLFNTPILLIVFNKVEATQLVFNTIRTIKPTQLFVAADGPRLDDSDDKCKCAKVREIVKTVDWDCNVNTLFQENNLGCKLGVSTAISWFFQNVDYGIILEDDCLPNLSFFHFCQKLLIHYKNDDRVMMISGNNWQDGRKIGNASYFFSKFAFIWGWATWKRAWEKFDLEMRSYEDFKDQRLIDNVFNDERIKNFFMNSFDQVYNGELDTWDYIWVYTLFINNGLSIIPNVNLVSNIGFGISEATHTKKENIRLSRIKTMTIDKISHPKYIFPDREADIRNFNKAFEIKKDKKSIRKNFKSIKKKIKKIIMPISK